MRKESCCFIGHRSIEVTEELIERLHREIEALIKSGVKRFLFGSKSVFNDLCHDVVTELKKTYKDIVRVAYETRSERAVLETEKEKVESQAKFVLKKNVTFAAFEERIRDDLMYSSGKASYIERNMLMIDASDHCIFYYDPNYKPIVYGRFNVSDKSGTAIAYK